MRVAGIICEFNPFHNGHRYLMEQTREMGYDAVVCVMSGSVTQRGEPAILGKYDRAACAVVCGADLVVELPFPFCAADGDRFASGAVSVLNGLTCVDTIFFGSECGSLELLTNAARFALSDRFQKEYAARLARGEGSARAYYNIMEEHLGTTFASNDALGISYIKALITSGSRMDCRVVKRIGEGFFSQNTQSAFPCATAVRQAMVRGDMEAVRNGLPADSFDKIRQAIDRRLAPILWENAEQAVLSYFRLTPPNVYESTPCLPQGMAEQIRRAASLPTLAQFAEALSSPRIPSSRIRRILLYALCGVKEDDLKNPPSYTNLLAADTAGLQLLHDIRKSATIAVIAKPADAPEGRQTELERRLEDLISFCYPSPRDPDDAFRSSPVIFQ